MKKVIILSLLFVVSMTIFNSCKKKSTASSSNTNPNADLLDIEVPYTKAKTLPDSIAAMQWSLPIELNDTFATKVDEYLATYGAGITKDKIVKIAPLSMNATIDNANAQTLDFIDDSVKVYVDAYNGTNPRLVAVKYGILPGAKSIDFTVIDSDIKDYFNSEYMEFTLKFNSKINQGMLANTTFITNIKFKITAKKP
jgi:hypothetical protein